MYTHNFDAHHPPLIRQQICWCRLWNIVGLLQGSNKHKPKYKYKHKHKHQWRAVHTPHSPRRVVGHSNILPNCSTPHPPPLECMEFNISFRWSDSFGIGHMVFAFGLNWKSPFNFSRKQVRIKKVKPCREQKVILAHLNTYFGQTNLCSLKKSNPYKSKNEMVSLTQRK